MKLFSIWLVNEDDASFGIHPSEVGKIDRKKNVARIGCSDFVG